MSRDIKSRQLPRPADLLDSESYFRLGDWDLPGASKCKHRSPMSGGKLVARGRYTASPPTQLIEFTIRVAS